MAGNNSDGRSLDIEYLLADRGGHRRTLRGSPAFAAMVASGLFGFNYSAQAQLPTDGRVTAGTATITQPGSTQMTINQSSQYAVYDWRTFNIGAGSRVEFQTLGASATSMNRVLGPDPSVIKGALISNGRLILVNQAGVFFANGAQVRSEALIVSTAMVSNIAPFMQGGKVAFDQASANPNARVVNDGTITVRDGGLVALVGPSAANNGVINARLGQVQIAGAETFTVDLNGDGLVSFAIDRPVSQTPRDASGKTLALASNTGTINADGGQVAITAAAAREVVDGVVNVAGRINARTVQNEGGIVVFGGGETTRINVAGKIDVSGTGAGQKGGTVHVTAAKVNVRSTARINANGDAGGGTVLVGGGVQGKGLTNAKATSVAKGARISADATGKGNGGTVVVWADNATVFAGTISARGGAQGGDGGFVGTSASRLTVSPDARVDAVARAGRPGTWLLDPHNLTIGGTDSHVGVAAGGIATTADGASVAAHTITSILNAGTNVVVQTSAGGSEAGDITVASAITWNSATSLTLAAHRGIAIDAAITGNDSGSALVLNAGGAGTITQSGTGVISVGTLTLSSAGGDAILANPANAVATLGDASLGVGNLRLVDSQGGLHVAGTLTASSIHLTSSGDITISGTIAAAGVTLKSGGLLSAKLPDITGIGPITVGKTGHIDLKATAALANIGPVYLSAGDVRLGSAGTIEVTIAGATDHQTITLKAGATHRQDDASR